MTGITLPTATTRFLEINSMLADASERGSVTVGLAQLFPGYDADTLIEKADADLYQKRSRRT